MRGTQPVLSKATTSCLIQTESHPGLPLHQKKPRTLNIVESLESTLCRVYVPWLLHVSGVCPCLKLGHAQGL